MPAIYLTLWCRSSVGSGQSTDGGAETFELVVFSRYEVEERAPSLREGRAWIGDATCKKLDRTTVEALVGEKV